MAPSITFSALLSVYKNDTPGTLDECIRSLHVQTEPLDEVIVVQEGEVPAALEACLSQWQRVFGEKFSWYKLPFQNGPLGFGLPKCLNYGIEHAKSLYIMRVDTDDICLPNRVAAQKRFIRENPGIKLFGCFIQEFDEQMTKQSGIRSVPLTHADIERKARLRNPFNGQTVVFEKEAALQLGGYPNTPSNEDYCFWANFLMKKYSTANMPEILVNVRAGDELIVRRSSPRYRQGEYYSLKYLKEIGFFTPALYAFHRVSKTLIRKLPKRMVGFFYNRVLRS